MKLLNQHSFDLLITDIHMPYHNGDEIMRKLNDGRLQKAPVIMMSSDGEEEVKALAKKQGVMHFITKPFNIADFVKIVKSVFDSTQPGLA
jgi:two-component system chemotaxis response regulator CheY